jgi:hypothetical protein
MLIIAAAKIVGLILIVDLMAATAFIFTQPEIAGI